ncbi:MAG: hypothetical protein LBH59_00020 [Planctomycetaceae bacterium]|nr:hypothetical protein [Planctomycetaceae bacterium]
MFKGEAYRPYRLRYKKSLIKLELSLIQYYKTYALWARTKINLTIKNGQKKFV